MASLLPPDGVTTARLNRTRTARLDLAGNRATTAQSNTKRKCSPALRLRTRCFTRTPVSDVAHSHSRKLFLKAATARRTDYLATGLLSLTFGGRGARPNDEQPNRPILFFVCGTAAPSFGRNSFFLELRIWILEFPRRGLGTAYRKKYPPRLMRNFGTGKRLQKLIDQRTATTQGYF